MVVAASTDKVTRTIADVRGVVKDCGAKLADPGSILFKFRRARVVNVKAIDADKDQILGFALDAGAEDVIEPTVYDDDSLEDHSERSYSILLSQAMNLPIYFSLEYFAHSCVFKYSINLRTNGH